MTNESYNAVLCTKCNKVHRANADCNLTPEHVTARFTKRSIMRLLLILLMCLITLSVFAASQILWKYPTVRTDGTPMALSEFATVHLLCGTSSGNYTMPAYSVKAPATSYNFGKAFLASKVKGGKYYCVLTDTDTAGRTSGYSNEVVINYSPKSLPLPPVVQKGLVLDITTTLP